MVKFKKGRSVSGPSSAIGLMRFFDTETRGPKITPQFVIAVCIAIAAIWLIILHFFS